MANNRRLVITGANGFLGARLVEMALLKGWHVTALARNHDRLARLRCPELSLDQWSLGDPLCSDEPAGVEAICHLAAFIPPDLSDPSYAEECFRINAQGTLDVVKLALERKVRRFVLFSSGQIYAFSPQAVCEDDPLYPANRGTFYLSSKLAAELFVRYFQLNHSFPATILRISSVYGSGMRDVGLVPKFVRNASEGIPLEVYDGGRHTMDLVHVDDVVGSALIALERGTDGIFNIGSGIASSALQLACAVVEVLGTRLDIIKLAPPTGDTAPSGFSALDITKARNLLGYDPVGLKEGLRKWLGTCPCRDQLPSADPIRPG